MLAYLSYKIRDYNPAFSEVVHTSIINRVKRLACNCGREFICTMFCDEWIVILFYEKRDT